MSPESDSASLARQAARYRALIEHNPDAVYTLDFAGRLIDMNRSVARLTGYSLEELREMPFHPLIHSEDLPQVTTSFYQALNGEPQELQFRVRHKRGHLVHVAMSASPYILDGERRGVVGISRDISARVAAEERLRESEAGYRQESERLADALRQLSYQATHDALTGLFNRYEFERRLHEAMARARSEDLGYAVCYIDLDRFKFINDTAGHSAGDALLRKLGEVMRRRVDTFPPECEPVLARLGGDEFGLLCRSTEAEVREKAEALLRTVSSYDFPWQGRQYRTGASIGIAPLTAASESIDEVLSQADVACYAAKSMGRNRISLYRPGEGEAEAQHHRLRIAAQLRESLEANRFRLYAQPIVSTGAAGPPHVELLLRMLDEQGRILAPDRFIPASEHYGLMDLVDRWVLHEALVVQAPRLAAVPGIVISINLAAQSLSDPDFPGYVEDLVSRCPLPARRIHFEVTETAAVTQLEGAAELTRRLRARGCCIALDDFGSGLSSFNYLKRFPVDILKIDGSFIRQLKNGGIDRAIVESIHDIARKVGARTVAEFVEDEELLGIVRELGIDYAQGYGIGRPCPLEDFLERLEARGDAELSCPRAKD